MWPTLKFQFEQQNGAVLIFNDIPPIKHGYRHERVIWHNTYMLIYQDMRKYVMALDMAIEIWQQYYIWQSLALIYTK